MRQFAREGDIESALKVCPHHLVAERCVLQGLKEKGPNNYVQALLTIPTNLRLLYIHAFQVLSFYFN